MKLPPYLFVLLIIFITPLQGTAQEVPLRQEKLNIDTLVSYPGGDIAFNNFIRSHLFITKQAVAAGLSGDVILQFVIDEKGLPGEYVFIQRLGSGCDEQALIAMRLMPPWQPGVISGRRIKSTLQKTIHFDTGLPVTTDEPAIAVKTAPDSPLFFGEDERALAKYITAHFSYPAGLPKNIKEVIVVKFSVNHEGRTGSIHIISGISEELDAEAIRLIRNMPPWKPKVVSYRPTTEYKELIIGFKNRKALLQQL